MGKNASVEGMRVRGRVMSELTIIIFSNYLVCLCVSTVICFVCGFVFQLCLWELAFLLSIACLKKNAISEVTPLRSLCALCVCVLFLISLLLPPCVLFVEVKVSMGGYYAHGISPEHFPTNYVGYE